MTRRSRRAALAAAVALTASAAFAGATANAATSPAAGRAIPAHAATAPCGTLTTAPTYKHVIVLFMENESYGNIHGSSKAPYINSLAAGCGIATNYHNITHDSLPNYVGMTDGGTLSALKKFDNDCSPSSSCDVTTTNLYNEVASKGGWKGYDESMPSACHKSDSGQYAVRHNPAVYYTDLSTCAADDVALGTTTSSSLLTDFASQSTAPAFSFVTPNLCDDMHGNTECQSNLIKNGDTWLSTWIPLITSTPVYRAGDTVILLTWDEGAGGSTGENCATNTTDQSCHVLTVVIAPSVKPGTVDSTLLNHYSLLKTTEDILGVPELGLAQSATSMQAAFNLG